MTGVSLTLLGTWKIRVVVLVKNFEVSSPVFHSSCTIVVVEYEIRRFGFLLIYKCSIKIIWKHREKNWMLNSKPLECVSRAQWIASTINKNADTSLGNITRFEDWIGCLIG